MIFREAEIGDIKQIQIVRNKVKENTLSDPNLVTDEDCKEFITARGKGWVCEIDNSIVGFAIADLKDNNIWALFLDPEFEKKGIGHQLHAIMLDWYFAQTKTKVWLGTAFNTRAESFYRKAGWAEVGLHGTKEIKFEMTYEKWNQLTNTKIITNQDRSTAGNIMRIEKSAPIKKLIEADLAAAYAGHCCTT